MSHLQDILLIVKDLESRISKIEQTLSTAVASAKSPVSTGFSDIAKHPIFTQGYKISLSTMPFYKLRDIYLNMGGFKENCMLDHMVKYILSYPKKLTREDFYTIIFNFNLDDHFAHFIGQTIFVAPLSDHIDFLEYCFCI